MCTCQCVRCFVYHGDGVAGGERDDVGAGDDAGALVLELGLGGIDHVWPRRPWFLLLFSSASLLARLISIDASHPCIAGSGGASVGREGGPPTRKYRHIPTVALLQYRNQPFSPKSQGGPRPIRSPGWLRMIAGDEDINTKMHCRWRACTYALP
jgi:hypothetical protein